MCSVASPKPRKHLQGAAKLAEDISVARKGGPLTDLPNDFNIQTRVLDASFNSITALKNNKLARNYLAVKTYFLNFSHNAISSIEVLAFSGLTQLQKLDLSHNKLTTLHPKTFIYTRHILWLQLSNNNMLTLPANGHFVEAQYLRTLDLSFCNLEKIPMDTFHCAPNLKYIRLDSNKLTTLNVSVFTEILPDKELSEECNASATSLNKLVYLNISANPLKCDCHFYKMRKLLEKFGIKYELQSSCDNPKYNVRGVCGDKGMNQHNQISSVGSEATIGVVAKDLAEHSSGNSVITSATLPSVQEATNTSPVNNVTASTILPLAGEAHPANTLPGNKVTASTTLSSTEEAHPTNALPGNNVITSITLPSTKKAHPINILPGNNVITSTTLPSTEEAHSTNTLPGNNVIISTALPSTEEAHPTNTLLQTRNVVTTELTQKVSKEMSTMRVPQQKVSEVSKDVTECVTEATSLDHSSLITPSFRMMIIVMNVLLCVFIVLAAVLFVLFLRQSGKLKKIRILKSDTRSQNQAQLASEAEAPLQPQTNNTVSQNRNGDYESDALKHYEKVGIVPSNWTPFGGPHMCSDL
jgi:hypothetical protein